MSLFDGKRTPGEIVTVLMIASVVTWFTHRPTHLSAQAFDQLPRAEKIAYLKTQGLAPMTQERFAALSHDQKVEYLRTHGVTDQAR